jgi:hypothetical protein
VRRSAWSRSVVALTGAILLACGTPPDETAADRRAAEQTQATFEMRPDLMVADPEQVAPGEQVALTFPEETGRGLGFALDQQTDDGWQRRAYLTSAPGDGPPDEPAWHPPDPRPEWESVGIGGPGPDVVQIPDELDPGSYRICDVMSGDENICTPIAITD